MSEISRRQVLGLALCGGLKFALDSTPAFADPKPPVKSPFYNPPVIGNTFLMASKQELTAILCKYNPTFNGKTWLEDPAFFSLYLNQQGQFELMRRGRLLDYQVGEVAVSPLNNRLIAIDYEPARQPLKTVPNPDQPKVRLINEDTSFDYTVADLSRGYASNFKVNKLSFSDDSRKLLVSGWSHQEHQFSYPISTLIDTETGQVQPILDKDRQLILGQLRGPLKAIGPKYQVDAYTGGALAPFPVFDRSASFLIDPNTGEFTSTIYPVKEQPDPVRPVTIKAKNGEEYEHHPFMILNFGRTLSVKRQDSEDSEFISTQSSDFQIGSLSAIHLLSNRTDEFLVGVPTRLDQLIYRRVTDGLRPEDDWQLSPRLTFW